MNANRYSSNWNKVVLIPVVETKNSSGSTTKIIHDMTLRSTRLVGGEDNKDNPIKISVIYSKFNQKTMADNFLERHQLEYEEKKENWLRKKKHLPKLTRKPEPPEDETL